MLATLERILILDKADELAAMILESDVVENYRDRLNILKTNQESQAKISLFMSLKEQYEDVQRFGKYHPDYKFVMKQVREVKRSMDLDENVAAFRKAENQLQQLLDEISVMIGHSVSQNVKVPTGNPFFDGLSSCGGGCGSGGACSCSA
ncbi:YlbF family regulator [Bacillus sp. 03113]|uniref:YlbF family regulator n=1 Tax=Bacillus sp. 03113 TaxID=2578211 RepID=UPI001141FE38|nr:YlbF family regulator [Bacillus sp. 03113]